MTCLWFQLGYFYIENINIETINTSDNFDCNWRLFSTMLYVNGISNRKRNTSKFQQKFYVFSHIHEAHVSGIKKANRYCYLRGLIFISYPIQRNTN